MWFAVVAGGIVAMIVGAVVRAYVVAKLWGWYMVAAFGLPQISMTTAFGLSLIMAVFVPTPTPPKSDDEGGIPELLGQLFGLIIGPLIGYALLLLIGRLFAPE
jgi:hypothetical protein